MSELFPTVAEIQAMTRKQLVNLPSGTIRAIMKDTERREAFAAIVNTAEGHAAVVEVLQDLQTPDAPVVPETPVVEPTVEEIAAAEQQRAADEQLQLAAQQNEQQRLVLANAERVEAEAYAAAGITVTKDAAGNITKIVKKYQATDESGQPIGHPTHLEAKSWAELSMKQEAAHTNALRLAERVKKQKITFKPQTSILEPLTDDQVREYVRVLQIEPQTSEKFKEVSKLLADNKLADAQIRERGARDSFEVTTWMRKHLHDFAPNQANALLLDGFLRDNNLDFTQDNLEVAFLAVQDQLTGTNRPVATDEPENQPAAPAVAAPVAPVTTPVVAPAPVQTPSSVAAAPAVPAPVIQQAPARRPGVTGGIQPGSLTAPRLATPAAPTLTKADIRAMKPEVMRRRMKMEPGFTELVTKVLNSK